RIRVQQAGIGDEADPRLHRDFEHILMLRGTRTDLVGGDEEQPVHSLQRGAQRLAIHVIRLANLNAPRGQVDALLGRSGDGHYILRLCPPIEDILDDEPSQVSTRSRNCDHSSSHPVPGAQLVIPHASRWNVSALHASCFRTRYGYHSFVNDTELRYLKQGELSPGPEHR